jgi:hypothetical protein
MINITAFYLKFDNCLCLSFSFTAFTYLWDWRKEYFLFESKSLKDLEININMCPLRQDKSCITLISIETFSNLGKGMYQTLFWCFRYTWKNVFIIYIWISSTCQLPDLENWKQIMHTFGYFWWNQSLHTL